MKLQQKNHRLRPTVCKALIMVMTGTMLAGSAWAQINPQLKPMTKAEAQEYIKDNDIYPVAGNLAGAIMNGRVDDVRAMLAIGVDPNEKTALPQSPIKLAAMSCSGRRVSVEDIVTMIRVLAQGGATVNPANADASPMITAAQQCPAPVIKALLEVGGDKAARTTQGFTPLSMAFIVRNYDAAKELMAAGATLSKDAANKLTSKDVDAEAKALIKQATK